MSVDSRKIRFRSRFDFEVGYLVKSPCQGCDRRPDFPTCLNRCQVIDQIQEILAESITCRRGG